MPKHQYNIQLKGYVGGYDFDRNTINSVLANNNIIRQMYPTLRENLLLTFLRNRAQLCELAQIEVRAVVSLWYMDSASVFHESQHIVSRYFFEWGFRHSFRHVDYVVGKIVRVITICTPLK